MRKKRKTDFRPGCAEKWKRFLLFPFSHPYFSTGCGKRGGKTENACNLMIFPMLKTEALFNLAFFDISERCHFCITAKHTFSTQTHQKREFLGCSRLSPKFITFFPFPQGIFSTVSTSKAPEKAFHISEKTFHRFSLFANPCFQVRKNKHPQCFSDFSTFSTRSITITPKASLYLSFLVREFPKSENPQAVDFSTKPAFPNPRLSHRI